MRKIVGMMWALYMLPFLLNAQEKVNLNQVTPGRFDQGKMWIFENPPVTYFEEAYGFTPTKEWMEDVRRSALRFSSWCSASFISANGLIMTNHHCSRSVVASVMKEGENFDDNGFYAEKLEDERQVPDLFVEQLWMIADITDQVKALKKISTDSAIAQITKQYGEKEDWRGLKLENKTFYSGGKFSLYGFKRFSDVRLVLYPEVAMGYFGGDPDNFTFPRYNLDFTFFRAYDENGVPMIPTNYYEFNAKGASEGEVVFVIGNPGSTGRYLTMSQLYYQRDVVVPVVLTLLNSRTEILMKTAANEKDVYVKDSITNLAFSLSNSFKAYKGRLEGLNDDYLMAKKEKKEQQVRSNVKVEGEDPWMKIENNVIEARNYFAETVFLSPSSLRGKVIALIHALPDYALTLDSDDADQMVQAKTELELILKDFDKKLERELFVALISEWAYHSNTPEASQFLGKMTGKEKAEQIFDKSMLINDPNKFFGLKSGKLDKEQLLIASEVLVPQYHKAVSAMKRIGAQNHELEEKIANKQFQISGVSSPPDATFSLRLSDGVVKGYEYNGTTAPYKTTYFGLYDRYYSNDGKFPWNLPERWKNPPMELLSQPMNFVCTADIIGGNSGSPLINKNQEVVGLAFDGNIESLPGYFIFDDTFNRTVSVHSGGMAAALKYIYKADRLMKELNIE